MVQSVPVGEAVKITKLKQLQQWGCFAKKRDGKIYLMKKGLILTILITVLVVVVIVMHGQTFDVGNAEIILQTSPPFFNVAKSIPLTKPTSTPSTSTPTTSLQNISTSSNPQKPTPTEVINYYLAPSSTPENPTQEAHDKIELLRPDQTIQTFAQELGGPPYTESPPWDDPNNPGIVYQEYLFEGQLSAVAHYYIQAITESGSDNVVFWSLTVCDPSTTFSVTDPSSGKGITLNQDSFADVIKISDNRIGDDDQEAPSLHYNLGGFSSNGYETEDEYGGDRLYVGVNNTCSINNEIPFPNLGQQPVFLDQVSNSSTIVDFRQNTKINTVGMSGWNDEIFYYSLENSNGEMSVGYNFLISPPNGYGSMNNY